MATIDGRGPALARAVVDRTAEIVEALRVLDAGGWRGPSALEGWSRLTVACHLRYGAEALCRMTVDSLAGRSTSHYPSGRERERPVTLAPAPGETPSDVVESLVAFSGQLPRVWGSLRHSDWELMVRQRPSVPARIAELASHQPPMSRCQRSRIVASCGHRRSHVPPDGRRAGDLRRSGGRQRNGASAVIEGTSRDVLALLLGRPTAEPLQITGDQMLAASFCKHFPGPGDGDRGISLPTLPRPGWRADVGQMSSYS
jgi:hypothetical protein